MKTMVNIPEELLEQAERGNVLLFVGERVMRDSTGQVVLDQLTAQLAARGGLADTGDITLPEAAQLYEDAAGRQALVQFVRDQFEALGDEPQAIHRLIAGLIDCTLLVTTCLDKRLERAFAEAGRPLDVITGSADIAFEDERKPRLYRLRGALERVDSLVLTEDDYETFFDDQASISVVLQGYLARKTILFVGYDLADPLNSLERPIAMRILFTVALRDSARGRAIRDRLESDRYAKSSDPITRIWSNKTLALLGLADQAHAAITATKQWDQISYKLGQLSQTEQSVFDRDLSVAAGEAHDWMEQRATREKE